MMTALKLKKHETFYIRDGWFEKALNTIKENESKIHRTIKKVTSDIDDLKMNTAIAALMTLFNDLTAKGNMTKGEFKTFSE